MSNKHQHSKFLSLVLRHKPNAVNIKLDENGWANVDELLDGLEKTKRELSLDQLREIVMLNEKKRFEFNENGTKIRAVQGHSVKVNLDLKAQRPPMKLYHGTVEKAVKPILEEGLNKMKRHAVHLSEDIATATSVGSRRGEAIILEIDSGAMYANKIKFYKSKNGVWLTDNVPAKYIKLHK